MLIQNAIKITENHPDEFFLVSAHRHDYVSYTFKKGYSLAIDGGDSYQKFVGDFTEGYGTDWVDWSLDDKVPFDTIKDRLLWGTYGKDGKSPLKYVLLKNCETGHLEKILEQKSLGALYKKVIISIIKDRLPKFNRKEVFAAVDASSKRMSKKK